MTDRPATSWPRHLLALGIAATLLLVLFRRDVADLTTIWWTSTTFGHCLFIAPVIAWLVWQRRVELAQLTPVGWWPGLALVAVGGAGWLMGDAASVNLARQLGLVLMLQGAVVAILGPNKIVERPMFQGDDIVRAKLMNFSISCDHRVVDGWDAASYVQALKKLVETPVLLFAD